MSVQLDDELAHHVPAASRRQPRADARHDARVARLVALAHSYGPLRRVDASQAAVVRRAAEHDRRVLPRWQRAGDSIHEDAPPGAYASLAAWRSREHWLQIVVPAAIAARPNELRSHEGEARWSVSADTFLAYCRTVSLYAHQSGRRCIVRPDRLAELMETSKRTVQRCQRIAERLGLYVVVVPGRMLTVAECWRAREQGSRQRGLANESALMVPSWLPHAGAWSTTAPDPAEPSRSGEPVDNSADNPWSQKTCVTPTRGREPQPRKFTVSGSLEPRSAGKSEPTPSAPSTYKRESEVPEGTEGRSDHPEARRTAAQRPYGASSVSEPIRTSDRASGELAGARPQGPGRRQRVYDPAALELARALVTALPWLLGTAPGRLEPMLRKFATRPNGLFWTAGDLIDAFDATDKRLARASMTRTQVKNAPALLASYLRDLEPDADHPRIWLDPDDHAVAARPVDRTTGPTTSKRARNRQLLDQAEHHRGGTRPLDSARAAEIRSAIDKSQ